MAIVVSSKKKSGRAMECSGLWGPNWAGKIKYILRPKLETEKIWSLIETAIRNWSLNVVSV